MIAIVDYGAGNLRSVQKALEFLGERAEITSDKLVIQRADGVVLPGVGAFAAGMQGLKNSGLTDTVLGEAKSGKPFLGICLGMQMLLESSEEGGLQQGLGLIPGCVRLFQVDLKIPHMGWNGIYFAENPLFQGLEQGANVYFVHSYYCDTPSGFRLSETEYGVRFTSAVRRENLFGVQFHPEKSGEVGLHILKNFIGEVRA